MKIIELIEKKKQSQCYTKEEINFIIEAVTKGEIADYQIAAWLMAVWFKGMNADETACLTEAIVNSGNKIDLSELGECIVDKHSTGGVGDKVTLILIPLLAAAGFPLLSFQAEGSGIPEEQLISSNLSRISGQICQLMNLLLRSKESMWQLPLKQWS
jgi:thymidine phosphorylase